MWTIFKVFTELATTLFLLNVFWPQGMWDLSSPTRMEPTSLCLVGKVLATGLPGNSQRDLTFDSKRRRQGRRKGKCGLGDLASVWHVVAMFINCWTTKSYLQGLLKNVNLHACSPVLLFRLPSVGCRWDSRSAKDYISQVPLCPDEATELVLISEKWAEVMRQDFHWLFVPSASCVQTMLWLVQL